MARRKMNLRKTPEAFIEGAKENEDQKEKTFLLRLPYEIWKRAKTKAVEEEKTLQEFILEAVKEKVF